MKLLLSSFGTSAEQDEALAQVIGKPMDQIRVAYIENAYDPYDDEAALIEGREILRRKGYAELNLVDLRHYRDDNTGLREALAHNDIFLFTGGNPFYLRWMMKISGADAIIIDLVKQGKVYSAASGGAVVAGPTLRYFDNQDDPNEAGEIIWEGLGLTQTVPVPHVDNEEFGAGCREAGEALKKEGYQTVFLKDAEALLIDGERQEVI